MLLETWCIDIGSAWGPVTNGDKIFVAGAGDRQHPSTLSCYSNTGNLLWSYPGHYSNPVIMPDGTIVVAKVVSPGNPQAGQPDEMYLQGYNEDGTLRWQTYIPGGIDLGTELGDHNALSAENGNVVFYNTASVVYTFHGSTSTKTQINFSSWEK